MRPVKSSKHTGQVAIEGRVSAGDTSPLMRANAQRASFVKGGEKTYQRGVDGQRKCPAKWPAKMSLVLLVMITDGSYSTRSSFMGGLRASMYFFAVSRWMPI